MGNRLVAIVAMILVATAAAGCGADDDQAPPNASENMDLEKLLASVSQEQRPALSDGKVTQAEYEQAFFSMVQCMEQAGVTIIDRPYYDDETNTRLNFSYDAGPTLDRGRETLKIEDDCRNTWFNGINYVWLTQDAPTEETLQNAREALATCLREAGLDVGEHPSSAELASLFGKEGFDDCASEVQREFRLPGFIG